VNFVAALSHGAAGTVCKRLKNQRIACDELRDMFHSAEARETPVLPAFLRGALIFYGWLGKPVIAINTATYWHALRQNGITDKMQGFGRLLEEF
jgi:hypothetical protein